MKIGVLSDTHLTQVHQSLGDSLNRHFGEVDLILHAGDVVEPAVLDFFCGRDLVLVAGNMDSPSIRKTAPIKRVIPIGRFAVGLIHGWGSPVGIEERIIEEFDSIDVLVYGHTHRASSHLKNGVLFFNPGSPTDKRFTSINTIGILEIGEQITSSIIPL
jgi:putative phosphoesterase